MNIYRINLSPEQLTRNSLNNVPLAAQQVRLTVRQVEEVYENGPGVYVIAMLPDQKFATYFFPETRKAINDRLRAGLVENSELIRLLQEYPPDALVKIDRELLSITAADKLYWLTDKPGP